MEIDKNLYNRFWDKVVDNGDSCWEWLGSHNKGGYGLFWPQWRSTWTAHRFMFALEKGELIEGLEIHHTCNNPGCVNPDHLVQVSHRENLSHTAKSQQTHCKAGHEFTTENTYIKPNGCRNCKACQKARDSKARRRL